jgi:hypothetical protein
MTYEKSRSTWGAGFMGYKNPKTGKLDQVSFYYTNKPMKGLEDDIDYAVGLFKIPKK